MSQHLLFEAAGVQLAAPAKLIHAIHEELPIQSVSGTRAWFLGVAVAQGKLLPVTDLSQFTGGGVAQGRTLELANAIGMAGLRVDRVFGLSDAVALDADSENVSMDDISAVNLTLTGQIVRENDRQHRIVDLAALVQSPVFVNIEEPEV